MNLNIHINIIISINNNNMNMIINNIHILKICKHATVQVRSAPALAES